MEMREGRPRPDCVDCGDYIDVDGEATSGWVELMPLNNFIVAVVETFWTSLVIQNAGGGYSIDSKVVREVADEYNITEFVTLLKRVTMYITNFMSVLKDRPVPVVKPTEPKKENDV